MKPSILVKRHLVDGEMYFEVLKATPEYLDLQLRRIFLDGASVAMLLTAGVGIKDWDAFVAESVRNN